MKKEGEGWAEKVELVHCLIYAALKATNEGDHEVIASWNKDLPKYIEEGKIKSNPINNMGQGLDRIPEGLEYLKSGKVSRSACQHT